jgi:MFS family permease
MRKETDRNLALFILCAASFLVPFMGSAINLSLPQISETFSMKAVSLSWIATAYLIATAIFQVPFARLADLVGRKRIFTAGIAIFGVATFMCGLTHPLHHLCPSGILLIVFRAVSGLGCAMMFGTSMAILTSIFPPDKRGKAIGINTSIVYFALASGPFLGGVLTHYLGWQSLFYLTGLVGCLVAAGAFAFLKGEWVEAKGEKFDLTGSVIFAAGLFCLIFGFSGLPGTAACLLIAAGLAASFFFVFYELRHRQPVFNVRIFSGNRIFGFSSLSALINYACTSAVAFMMSLYLQYIRGFDAHGAGLILIVQAGVQCVVSLYAGRWSDRFNPSLIATAGMGIILAGLVGFIFLSPDTSLVVVIGLLALLGVGFGMFSSPNANVIMSSVDRKYYGQASATIGTVRLTGQAFSMGIAMMAISLHLGNRLIVPELYPLFMRSFRMTFEICAVLCLVGTYASTFRTRRKREMF